jgi:hypothetical protein
MSTAGPEFSQTLTAQLFGPSSERRAFAVLAWVLAVAGQAFAVTLLAGQTAEPPMRDLPREQAERTPAAPRQAARVWRVRIDEPTRDGAEALLGALDDTRRDEQADDLVDDAESRLDRITALLRGRAACPLGWSWMR